MKNNHHQTFVGVCLITYVHVKLTLCICCLFRLYKNMLKKSRRQKSFLEDKKIKIKYKCAKNRIKQTNVLGYFECASLR